MIEKNKSLWCACFFLAPSAGMAAPLVATDSITVSEDLEVYTQLTLEGNGGSNNWTISSNAVSTAGLGSFGEFSIASAAGYAFAIFPGAQTGIAIQGDSRVEIGAPPNTFPSATGNPLTLTDSISGLNEPTIHFNTGEGVWGVGGNSGLFIIGDAINGNTGIPFSIQPGAPNWALHINPTGWVGVGTPVPASTFHVKVDDDAYGLPFLVENVNGINFSGFRLQIGPSSWIDFNNSGGNFRINADQTPGAEFEVKPNGNATISGTLTQNSDRNAKQDIEPVDYQLVLDKVMRLPISEWSFKDDPNSRHLGPMAQDFYQSFGLGDTDKGITSIDTGGVALAAIQGIKREKDYEIEQLKAENQSLQKQLMSQTQRMAEIELALAELIGTKELELRLTTETD
jgi:hypothetical protein